MFVLLLVSGCASNEALVEQFCELEAECDPRSGSTERCVTNYTQLLDTPVYDECDKELHKMLKCLAGLKDCAELDDYWEEPTPDYPCNVQEAALDECVDF